MSVMENGATPLGHVTPGAGVGDGVGCGVGFGVGDGVGCGVGSGVLLGAGVGDGVGAGVGPQRPHVTAQFWRVGGLLHLFAVFCAAAQAQFLTLPLPIRVKSPVFSSQQLVQVRGHASCTPPTL